MAETLDAANTAIGSRKDADDKPLSSKFWLGEIKASVKREDKWVQRAERVVARYRDERNQDRNSGSERRTNILWSNTETLKSALFQGLGKPDVRRRFQIQGKDDRTARQAALVLERGLSYCADSYDSEAQIEACVEDELLPGRGSAWVVYEADVEEHEEEAQPVAPEGDTPEGIVAPPSLANGAGALGLGHNGGPKMVSEIKSQSVRFDHVYWRDFKTSAGRKWTDVWWVARGHDYSRDELRQYFPKLADKVPLNSAVEGFQATSKKGASKEEEDTFKRARVWEIWDKTKKQRVWVAEGFDLILQSDSDPYKLENFFPTVEPLYGVKTTSSLDPIPEYTLYQDQAEELDVIQTRITRLTDALRRRGVYDASAEGPDNQLSKLADAGDNEFLPYRNFAVLVEKGGLKNVFQAEDLTQIIEVVQRLSERSMQLVEMIYQITGISDIMRGASDAGETATAQRIKGQFGTMRLQRRQKRVQVFIRALYRIKAEILAEHFTREQLVAMTGIEMPLRAEQEAAKQGLAMMQAQAQQAQAMAQQGMGAVQASPPTIGPQPDPKITAHMTAMVKAVAWEDIAEILRSDKRRGYKVDIDTDALARVDDESEKQQRIEFMTSMQGFMETTVPAVMMNPALAPLAKETASFAVGAFKVGRQMEEAFEDTFQQIEEMAKAQMAKGPQPGPEEKKLMLEAKSREIDMQFKAKEAEADRQLKQVEFQHNAKMKEAEFAHQSQLEERKMQNAQMLAERQMELDRENKAIEFDQQRAMANEQMSVERERLGWEQHFKEQEANTRFDLEEQKLGHARETDAKKFEFERERHEQTLGFERDKHGNEMLGKPVDSGDGQPAQSSLGAMIRVLSENQQQQTQTFSQALEQLTQQTAEALVQNEKMMRLAMAPKRMVKDPKTGEKRVEIMMQ